MTTLAPTPTAAGARELHNPVLGLHAVITEPAGERFAAEVVADPGASGGPAHIHAHQEERFTLHAGELTIRSGRRRAILRAGDTLVVPPHTVHEFRNDGGELARFTAEFVPALRVGEFFAALFGLAVAGQVDARGLPSPLVAARLMHEFPDEFFYPPYVPPAIQRTLARPLAALARRRGA